MASRSEGLTVFVRVRPPIQKEVTQEFSVFAQGPQSLTVTSENKETSCTYDHVFNEVSDQSQVFEKVKPLLVDVLSGINSCIFAYGQTSAGKSYTMIGPNGGMDILKCDKKLWGILPRASEFLLGYLNEKSRQGQLSYEVKASFLQIYNENLFDLLRDSGPSMEETLIINAGNDEELKIREVPVARTGKGSARDSAKDTANEVFVSGLSEFRVQTSDDILRILAVGTSNRATRSTDFNLTSSRSHAILQLTFSIESHMRSGQTLITKSKLNLVDLAGSEKIPYYMSETNSQKHVKELTSINKSLSCLGNVISALTSTNRSHIPFRDSKLTRLLQDSLSGNTRTILIACVAPTVLHTSESLSTLQFADRARNVMLSVKANTVVDDKALLAKAQAEITRLKAMLTSDKMSEQRVSREKVEEEIERILSENEGLRKENEKLLKRMNSNSRMSPLTSVNNSYQSVGDSPAAALPSGSNSKSVSQKSWDPQATLAYALYDYNAGDEDELSFYKGDTLQVLETYDDDWWLVANREGDQGLAPSNYLTLDKVMLTSPPRERRTEATAATAAPGASIVSGKIEVKLPDSPEMRSLRELRDKTEVKMNALKHAVSGSSPVITEPKRSSSPSVQRSGGSTPTRPDVQKPTKSNNVASNRSIDFPAQSSKMPQVALDQGSLNFISKVINERLSKEFSERDERIINQVHSLINNGIADGPRRKISSDSLPDESSTVEGGEFQAQAPSAATAASVYNSTKGKSKIPRVFPKINEHVRKVDSFDDNQSVSSKDTRSNNKRSPRGTPSPGMPSSGPQSPTVEDAINKLPMLKNPYNKESSSKKGKAAAPKPDILPLEEIVSSPSEIHSSSENHPAHPSRINEVADAGLQYANCRSIVYPPSTFHPSKAPPKGPPDVSLQLQHVYGYSGTSANNKAQILSDNRVIFPAASVLVLMDPHDRRQSFFTGHRGEVTCFTLHSSRRIVASAGHIGKDSGILIWDSSSVSGGNCSQSVVMELKVPRGVKSIQGMSFSPDNKYLAVSAIDESRSLLIYEIMHGHLVAQSKIGLVELSQVCFNPYQFATRLSDNYESTSIGCYALYSFGGRQIKLWTLKVQVGDLPEPSAGSGKSPVRSAAVQLGNGEAKIHHTLEGGVGVIHSGGEDLLITSVVPIDDSTEVLDDEGNFVDLQPNSRLLCGTANGSIVIYQQLEEAVDPSSPVESAAYSWQPKGKVVSVVTEVHDCAVLDVSYISSGHAPGKQNFKPFERVLTSGVDGSLNLWEIIRSADARMLPLEHIFACELENKEVVRSIAWDVSGDMAVVGTTSNSLVSLLFSAADTATTISVTTEDILSCHQQKIKRVAVNPVVSSVFVTIGSDKCVRLWESTALRQIGCFDLPFSATAICFAPDGKTLAVGNEQGEFCVYTCTEFASLMGQNRKKIISMLCAPVSVLSLNNWVLNFKRNVTAQASPSKMSQKSAKSKHCDVTEIKFSPSGLVAVGCKDNLIHILQENGAKMNVYKHTAVCRGHSSFIKNLDFSVDSTVLQSTDAARELLFWDVASGNQLTNASDFRDVAMSSWSCVYGWPVHGVCNDTTGKVSADGDVHCVTRSPDSKLVLAGNNHNSANGLKLFNYPCLGDAIPSYYEGHSSPIQDVAFLSSGSKQKELKAISVGSSDACIFQWSVVKN